MEQLPDEMIFNITNYVSSLSDLSNLFMSCKFLNNKKLKNEIYTDKIEHYDSATLETKFRLSIMNGNYDFVELCLLSGKIFVDRNNYAINTAVRHDRKKIINLLIRANISDFKNPELFNVACQTGNLEVTKFLVDTNYLPLFNNSLNVQSPYNNTYIFKYLLVITNGLQLSSLYNHTNVIKYLLTIKHVCPAVKDNYPLAMAIQFNNIEIVELLLKNKSVLDNDGLYFTLTQSAKYGHEEIFVKALSKVLYPKATIVKALRFAIENCHYNIVKIILNTQDEIKNYDIYLNDVINNDSDDIFYLMFERQTHFSPSTLGKLIYTALEKNNIKIARTICTKWGPIDVSHQLLDLAGQKKCPIIFERLSNYVVGFNRFLITFDTSKYSPQILQIINKLIGY